MTRGNQREIDRQRAAKRAAKSGATAKDKDGLTALQRKERCSIAPPPLSVKMQISPSFMDRPLSLEDNHDAPCV